MTQPQPPTGPPQPWSVQPGPLQPQPAQPQPGQPKPGQPQAPSRETYRLRTPVVVFWVWFTFAVVNAIDLAIQWHHRAALVYGAILALATGVAYACALRPRLIADDAGITILNPLRNCRVPWGSVRAVDLGEAVQVHYTLPSGTDKVFPSWALFASSRSQLKADLRARRHAAQMTKISPSYSQLPTEAKEIMARTETQLIATQLDERAERARDAGAAAGQPAVTWAWPAVAALLVPCIALIILLLT